MTYVKKTWVNKPNKTTPIMADDLNHIEQGIYDNDKAITDVQDHLVNVSNEVDEDYRVNFIKGENLIDKNSVEVGNGIITNEGAFSANTTNKCILTYIEVEENKTYTLNYNGLYRVVFYNSSKTTISANANVSSPYTFTTPANTKYIRISGDLNINLDTMRLEEGSSIITPSIVVDNDTIYQQLVVLWQNSSPTSSFASGNISLSKALTNFSYYEIIYKLSSSSNVCLSTGKIPVGLIAYLQVASNNNIRRYAEPNSAGTQITIGGGEVISTYGSSATTDNSRVIPYQVIGYK